jgi:hypothetical protein
VIPLLVDWNKTVAVRLPALPGMKIGLLETNGHQNYTNWEALRQYHPCHGAKRTEPERGLFHAPHATKTYFMIAFPDTYE